MVYQPNIFSSIVKSFKDLNKSQKSSSFLNSISEYKDSKLDFQEEANRSGRDNEANRFNSMWLNSVTVNGFVKDQHSIENERFNKSWTRKGPGESGFHSKVNSQLGQSADEISWKAPDHKVVSYQCIILDS